MTQTTESGEYRPFDPAAEDPVDLVWPDCLVQPTRPPQLAYLDLNHWVGMAKAAVGHPDGGRYVGALQAARNAKSAGQVIFPLSGTHYMEIAKMTDPHRRRNLAEIMEELSDLRTLVSRFVILSMELHTVLNDIAGPDPSPPGPINLLGTGAAHSLGRRGGLVIVGPEGDVTERVRQSVGEDEFDLFMSGALLELERAILAGPQDAETEATLRASGWQPDAALKVAQHRADQEAHQVGVLDADPDWRKGRLRDVISAREVIIEFLELLLEGLARRGRSLDGMFLDRPSSRRFVRSMPSTEVAAEVKTHLHKNRQTKWDTNTIFDIDAMAVAVPYCDVVVTEKHACATLQRAGFEDRMGTVLLRRPEELEQWLAQLTQ